MAWELFTKKRGRALDGETFISFSPPGRIGISKSAFERWFQDHPYVTLAYDREGRRVALIPTRERGVNTYPVTCSKKRNSGAYIVAHAFFKYFNIIPGGHLRRPVYQEDSYIVADLKKEGSGSDGDRYF